MSIQEIKTEIEALPAEERKRLAAFLVSSRHKELDEYRAGLGRDQNLRDDFRFRISVDMRLDPVEYEKAKA